jgi:hypothetical protein
VLLHVPHIPCAHDDGSASPRAGLFAYRGHRALGAALLGQIGRHAQHRRSGLVCQQRVSQFDQARRPASQQHQGSGTPGELDRELSADPSRRPCDQHRAAVYRRPLVHHHRPPLIKVIGPRDA